MANEDKLKKLKALLEVANDGIGKNTFEKAFKTLNDFVRKVNSNFNERFNVLETFINKLSRELEIKYSNKDKEIKERLSKIKDGAKGDKGEKGDSVKGDKGDSGKSIQGINGADGSPDTPELIRDKLEFFKEDKDKLAITAIGFLEERLKKLEERPMGGGGGFSKIAFEYHLIDDETPTGTINGANKIFTLDNKPNPPESLKVYRGGARQRITEDYTFSSQTITFTLAPVSGEIILVDYRVG